MNAITARSVVSFYPRLVFANESLIFQGHSPIEPHPYTFTLTSTNSAWTKPCGPYCPMLRRITYGDPGVATYTWSPRLADARLEWSGQNAWSGSEWPAPSVWSSTTPLVRMGEWGKRYVEGWGTTAAPERPTDLRLQELLQWRISNRCNNPHCSNRNQSGERSRYLGPYV